MLQDPLEAPAAQIPDEWSFPTQAMKLSMTVDLTTDATGALALVVGNSMTSYLRGYSTAGGLMLALSSTTPHTDTVAYTTAFTRSRVTCASMSYLPTNTPESSQGTISFLSLPDDQVALYNGLSLATIGSDGVTGEIDEPMVVHVHDYSQPMFYSSHVYTEHLPSTMVILRGCKTNTTVGQLRMVLNMEGIANAASVHAGASTVEPFDANAIANGTHIQQAATNYQAAAVGRGGPRRLTQTGRAVADASAALAGMYVGGVGGAMVSNLPDRYRTLRKQLKKAMQAHGKSN